MGALDGEIIGHVSGLRFSRADDLARSAKSQVAPLIPLITRDERGPACISGMA